MLCNNVYTFYNYTALIHQHFFYNAWFACVFIITGNHHHFITFPDVELRFESCFHFILLSQLRDLFFCYQFLLSIHLLLRRTLVLLQFYSAYNTSGAKEIIFIYPLSRSSLATGPKILVPLGSSDVFNNTTALSSKRI